MKFTQVWRYAEKGNDKTDEEKQKYCHAQAKAHEKKLNVQNAINDRRGQFAGGLLKAQGFISRAPHIQQFLIGGATGWATGFVTSRVGKTVAIIGGTTVLLMVGANQAGIIHINWDKFGKRIEETGNKLEAKVPSLKSNVNGIKEVLTTSNTPKKFMFQIGKYARANTYFAAGFVGGFLLGIAS